MASEYGSSDVRGTQEDGGMDEFFFFWSVPDDVHGLDNDKIFHRLVL